MSAKDQPVTFYVPASAGEPMEMNVHHSGLKMVLLHREAVHLLSDAWNVLGVYFLLGPSSEPERYRAYVGEVGKTTLRGRLREHASSKPWWNRALLIASASNQFNSAEIGWLEGRLYDVLNNAVAADLMNGNRPGDDSISDRDRAPLERYVEPVMAALRASGAPPDTADQKPAPSGRKRPARYPESVKDLIDAGLLKTGTRLHPQRKQLTQTALVLEDGSLQVGEQVFAAVSPAAQAVSGNTAEPGWEFWGAPSGDGGFVPLFELRARLRAERGNDVPASRPWPAAPPAGPGRKKRAYYPEKITDLIAAGLLTAGEPLYPVRRDLTETATALDDGRILFQGEAYRSVSAAAQASTGNDSEPGWECWTVEREGSRVTLFDLRARLRASKSGSS